MNIKQSQNSFQLLQDQETLFNGMQVKLNLDHQGELLLPFKEVKSEEGTNHLGDYVEHKCFYQDQESGHKATISFQCFTDFTIAHVHAQLEEGRLFQSIPYLAPDNPVSITVQYLPENYQLMANYQHKDWWTRPHFGEDIQELPDKTQSLLIKTEENYYHLLPIVDQKNRTTLVGSSEGLNINVSSYQGGFRDVSSYSFIISAGNNPYELAELNVKRATSLDGIVTSHRENKTYPEILDYLGWCSWDAFYHDVNEEGLLEKANELKDLGIPTKWIMIDDGWSEIKDDRLFSFEADQEKFPSGLANTVHKLKETFGVNWVGVWHTIAGYWGGIHPESKIASDLQENLYPTNRGALVPHPEVGKGFGFWNTWHDKLRQDGIDFVKVDSQSAVANFLTHQVPIGEATAGTHTSLEASCSLHFNNTIINCMGMSLENVWNRPYSSISRNSDDFVPNEKQGFQEHAFQNVYNSFYHGPFYWGDWDMFWSINHDDRQNMVLRAISGGPIYVSDEIGQTNPEKIMPLVYQDGKIIRCDLPGLPTEDCLMVDPIENNIPLKVWNRIGDVGIVAAFNISNAELVEGTVSPQDVRDLDEGNYLVFDSLEHEYQVITSEETIDVQLQKNDTSLFVFIPNNDTLTPIGLMNKLIPTDSILEQEVTNEQTTIQLREGGKFAFVTEKNIEKVLVNEETVQVEHLHDNLYVVDCEHVQSTVQIEINY